MLLTEEAQHILLFVIAVLIFFLFSTGSAVPVDLPDSENIVVL